MALGSSLIDWPEVFRRVRKSRSTILLEQNKHKIYCLSCYKETTTIPCQHCKCEEGMRGELLARMVTCHTGLMRTS